MGSERAQVGPLRQIRSMTVLDWIVLVIAVVIPVGGGFLIGFLVGATGYNGDDYPKPPWSPPGWLFAPVWTILYIAMGVASFLVWKFGGGFNSHTIPALVFYFIQLVSNFLWSPLFFRLGACCGALIDISLLWGLIVACIVTFYTPSKVAFGLMWPYLVWVSFATALNYSICDLNGCHLPLNGTNSTN